MLASEKPQIYVHGTFRETAASGIVSDGMTNLTPDPAISPDIGSVKQGRVEIIH